MKNKFKYQSMLTDVDLPTRYQEIIGKKYHKITVTGYAGYLFRFNRKGKDENGYKNPRKDFYLTALCECGNKYIGYANFIFNNRIKSCGCLIGKTAPSNGISLHPLYLIYKKIISRCYKPNATGYSFYGAKGITVYSEWLNDFYAFAKYIGERPFPEATIDRIDGKGNYVPGNIRWATRKQQSENLSSNVLLTFNGKTQCKTAWANEMNINMTTLTQRLKLGWSVEKALLEPIKTKFRRKILN